MADLINLRQARKDKARAEKEAAAKANRAAHGRTKAEKKLTGAKPKRPPAIWTRTSAIASWRVRNRPRPDLRG
jgi:Domain of unknown function (DUF4169)